MENSIENLLNTLDDKFNQQPQSIEQIDLILQQLQQQIYPILSKNYSMYGYYQYIIAEKCLNNLELSDQQKIGYKRQKANHQEDYEDYLPILVKNMLTGEEKQDIEYQVSILERQNNQGAEKGVYLAKFVNNAFSLILSIPVKEVSQAIAKASLPVYRLASTTQTAIEGATVAANACVSKTNIIITLGIAAVELGYILWKYKQQCDKCSTLTQKKEAQQHLKQELKALGSRTVSSFAVTSSFAVAGATFGSIFPVIGTLIGGIFGAIVGAIASYAIDNYIIEPYFLKKIDFISESEKEIGLENFKTESGQDYTQEEFEQKIKRCLVNEHPDKFTTEALKKNARAKIFKILLAKEMIKKHRKWDL